MQLAPHDTNPLAHTNPQVAPEQVARAFAGAVQVWPHEPQVAGLDGSAHAPAHTSIPAAHLGEHIPT
jgi:hypothetical protein